MYLQFDTNLFSLTLKLFFLLSDGKSIFWCLIILLKILMGPVLLVFTTSVFRSRRPRSKGTTTTAVQNGINRWRSLTCLSTAFKFTNFDKIPSTKYLLVCWKNKHEYWITPTPSCNNKRKSFRLLSSFVFPFLLRGRKKNYEKNFRLATRWEDWRK
jgi:hypothetical protein